MAELVYDGTREARAKLASWLRENVTLLCPKCNATLIVALDAEAAAFHRVHPGIYCSRNRQHFFEMCELDSPERREIKRKWREKRN